MEGDVLRDDLNLFSQELREAIEEIWEKPSGEGDGASRSEVDSWARRMEEREKESHMNPVEKIGKPEVGQMEWGVNVLWRRSSQAA